MNTGTVILTRRIQLLVHSADKEIVHEAFTALYNWQHACFRAANYISTHYFLQEQVRQLLYLTEGTRAKLSDSKKDPAGILTTSRLNSTRAILVRHFKGQVPMEMLGCLNMAIFSAFNNEKSACLKGERSLRNYKRDIPIPFRGRNTRKWRLTEDEKNYAFNLFGIPFRTCLGKDTRDKKALLDKMIAGSVKLCSSSIQLKGAKIYLLAAFEMEKEKHALDEAVIAEASLSVDCPVMVTVQHSRYNIGSREEFLYRRLAIQAARQRLQKGVSYNRGGKGRKRKLYALDRFAETEKNYVSNKMHVYSRRLVDICIKHRAATLILTDQQAKEDNAREDKFLLRNWSYCALKEKIFYKAAKAGITIIME